MQHGSRSSAGWSLILWDIENVPVPEQLRNPAGIKQLKGILKDKFAKSRELQLHCIKLACRWPDHRSPYADLLGWLTTLGDIEALGYQWQGQKDKSHNADRLLKQAADRFMHMLEMHNGPDHLVVFITSDQDFGEKILELQRRNFKVAVIYHGPHASTRPASIVHAADESYDWLDFLKKELKFPKLTLSPYDSNVTQPVPGRPPSPPHTPAKSDVKGRKLTVKGQATAADAKQCTNTEPKVSKAEQASKHGTPKVTLHNGHSAANSSKQTKTDAGLLSGGNDDVFSQQARKAAHKVLTAIESSLPSEAHTFTRVVARACLANGFHTCPAGFQLVPVSCCQLGNLVRQELPELQGKLIANLQQARYKRFFKMIVGPPGKQPAVLLMPQNMIDKPCSNAVAKILAKTQASDEHPDSDSFSAGSQSSDASDLSDEAIKMSEDVILLHIHVALSNVGQEFIQAVASACLKRGLVTTATGYCLDPVPCTAIGMDIKESCGGFEGKLLTNLRSQECKPYFRVIDGPLGTQPAVLAKLPALIRKPHGPEIRRILSQVQIVAIHPSL